MICNCTSSPHMYGPAGHVVTGNPHIVEDQHIQGFLIKERTFRKQNNIDWNKEEFNEK